MPANQDVSFPFLFSSATHTPECEAIKTVKLTFLEAQKRNTTQLSKIQRLQSNLHIGTLALPDSDPLEYQCVCYQVDEKARCLYSINKEPLFREYLYLFNVLIALEWNPSVRSYQQIRLAAQRASDFLYDVTNGYMAIGQVIIGGPDLMDAADIQIMASNRLHPRSWIGALNDPKKFKPIRIGRGLWQKNQGVLLSWDTPEGYRSLMHEWGHYAYGLVDNYLKSRDIERNNPASRFWTSTLIPNKAHISSRKRHLSLVRKSGYYVYHLAHTYVQRKSVNHVSMAVPEIALAVQTLMANIQISEFADLKRTFARIQKYYSLMTSTRWLEGPSELPLPLPALPTLEIKPSPFTIGPIHAPLTLKKPEDISLPVEAALRNIRSGALDLDDPRDMAAVAHWLYVLKPSLNDNLPERIIAQGKIGIHDVDPSGFRLLGAALGDHVIMVSQVGEKIMVQRITLRSKRPQPTSDEWKDVTPPDINSAKPFFVDVIPGSLSNSSKNAPSPTHAKLRIQVTAPQQPTAVQIYSSGYPRNRLIAWNRDKGLSEEEHVPDLDGHVLLLWEASDKSDEKIYVCSYSQGGGPGTTGGGRLPITAGSSDGNAMLFFNENTKPLSAEEEANKQFTEDTDNKVRIVTTTITVGAQIVNGAEARSYIFSIASNKPLDKYYPSLVLYYDRDAPKTGGDLCIYRWGKVGTQEQWQRLTTYVPLDLPYVAIPLYSSLETAPNLMKKSDSQGYYVERYRIFWTQQSVTKWLRGKLIDR